MSGGDLFDGGSADASSSSTAGCVDSTRLSLAIFGAIFGTLALCTGFALAIWFLVARNHQLDKFFFLERGTERKRKEEEESKENEEADNMEKPSKATTTGEHELKELSVALEMEDMSPPMERAEERGQDKEEEKEEEEKQEAKQMDNVAIHQQNNGAGKGDKEAVHQQKENGETMMMMPLANGKVEASKLGGSVQQNGRRHEQQASPMPPRENEEEQPIGNGIHRKEASQDSLGTPPAMAERLRAMLSDDQFGMLEANRRRLEKERRQLRELGVI